MEWKLIRQKFGNEEFILSPGKEITLGRGRNNNIILTSLLISRKHCVLKVKDDEVTITDLDSSNGVFIASKRIYPNIQYSIGENDIIGFAWMEDVQRFNVIDAEKYIFKLIKVQHKLPIINQIQSENENSNVCLKKIVNSVPEIINNEKFSKDDHTKNKSNDVSCSISDSSNIEYLEDSSVNKKRKLDTDK